jgi:multiple sugar transport system permease protein
MKKCICRLAIYFLLIVGSVVFLMPLFWMISTALKPIDQTMSMPPTWIPYRLFTDLDGRQVSVIHSESIKVPSLLITVNSTGEKRIVTPGRIIQGKLSERNPAGEPITLAVTIIKEIPASAEKPWVRVMPEDVQAGIQAGRGNAAMASLWDVVPEESLMKKSAPRWGNFTKAVVAMKMFPMYLKNTLILCFLMVTGTVISSALAAYGFARVPWRGRNKVFVIALATMMIPFPVVMVPVYCLFKSIGWIGTLRPLWVGSFFAGAFNVFLLRQFFMTIPKDLSDAARIDGCSEFRIFWQIILPLCKPALMVVGLFQFMGTWNDFLGPLIYLTNQKDFTLALGLQFFQSQSGGTEWHYLMAASTLVVLPIILLFFFTQKTFIEGISMTGIKG